MAIAGIVALVVPAAVAQAQTFRLVDLPPPPGATYLTISDVNDSAMVVGVAGNDRFSAPFLFDGFTSSWLPVIENARSFAINNRGMVAGVRIRSGPAGDTRVFFTFDAIRGSDYSESPLPDDASTEIVRFTDGGIAILEPSTSHSYAIFESQVHDLLPTGGLRLGSEFVAAVSADQVGASAVLPQSRILDRNSRGEIVGVAANGVRTPRLGAFRVRNGASLPLDFQDVGEPRYLREAFAITDNGIIGVSGERPVGSQRIDSLLIPSGVPDPPRAPSFSVSGKTVTLTWSDSLGAHEYIVELGSASGLNDIYNASAGQWLSVTGRLPTGRYFVRLRARNGVGVSAPSGEVVIDVP
jgi:hypothetical protein